MTPLQAALREKFGTPEAALDALGLPASLLATDQGVDPAQIRRSSKMAKLSATAARVHAALTAHFAPRLAADAAMPDLTPAVVGITKANLGKNRAQIWAKAKTLVAKGVLANDEAGPDDVAMRILDMIDKQAPTDMETEAGGGAMPATPEADQTRDADPGAAGAPVTDPNAAVPPGGKKPGEEEEAVDGDPDPEMMKALMEKCGGDAALAKACYDICLGGAKDEVVDPAAEVPGTNTNPDRNPAKDEEAPMMKPAMDAAIASAVKQSREDARAEARAAQEARQAVRPWVGEVSIAFDTADEIYRAALEARGVKTKGVHASAFRTILEQLPKAGATTRLAQDERLVGGGGRRSESRAARAASDIRVLG